MPSATLNPPANHDHPHWCAGPCDAANDGPHRSHEVVIPNPITPSSVTYRLEAFDNCQPKVHYESEIGAGHIDLDTARGLGGDVRELVALTDTEVIRPRPGHHTYCAPTCLGLNGVHLGVEYEFPAEDGSIKMWFLGIGQAEPKILLSIADDQPAALALDEAERAGEVLAQLRTIARSRRAIEPALN